MLWEGQDCLEEGYGRSRRGRAVWGGGIGLVRGRAGLFGERDRASWREIRAVW